MTDVADERRTARRFNLALPAKVRYTNDGVTTEKPAQTRDVSFRGVYFLTDSHFEAGSAIEILLTLPQQITLAGDVHIRCFANILRVEEHDDRQGIAARIDRYEFLPAAA